MPVTKFLRVATSGRTIDGREITPQQIDQMAATYNQAKYGARVWIEHLRSLLPDSPFRSYGDVIGVQAGDDEDGNRVLLAQIDATPDLVKLNETRQKVYFSIEIDPNFANSGQAYLVGLAITDSPASLGTEILKFAQGRADAQPAIRDHLYSVAVETSLDMDGGSLMDELRKLFTKTPPQVQPAPVPSEMDAAVTAIASRVDAMSSRMDSVTGLEQRIADLSQKYAALNEAVSKIDANPHRPQALGPNSNLTDC